MVNADCNFRAEQRLRNVEAHFSSKVGSETMASTTILPPQLVRTLVYPCSILLPTGMGMSSERDFPHKNCSYCLFLFLPFLLWEVIAGSRQMVWDLGGDSSGCCAITRIAPPRNGTWPSQQLAFSEPRCIIVRLYCLYVLFLRLLSPSLHLSSFFISCLLLNIWTCANMISSIPTIFRHSPRSEV